MQVVDCTKQFEKMKAELLLIRAILHLSPAHDPVESVRLLYEEGREAFERVRGQKCEYATQWHPQT